MSNVMSARVSSCPRDHPGTLFRCAAFAFLDCRCCFRAFCDNHSKKTHTVEQFDHKKPVRVCDACFRHLDRNETLCVPKLQPYLALGGGVDPLALRAIAEIYNLSQKRDVAAASADVLESGAIRPLVSALSVKEK